MKLGMWIWSSKYVQQRGVFSIPNISGQAVSENLPLKQKIFRDLASTLPPHTILATNTSSISITKIAASAVREGVNPASEEGRVSAARVVGSSWLGLF